MEKLLFLIALLVLPAIASADAGPPFKVHGSVFRDQCRVKYEVPPYKNIAGAEVELKCTSGNQVTYTKGTKTDSEGKFLINVERDCGDEICRVSLVNSYNEEYQTPCEGRDVCHVTLTANNGIADNERHCNALCYSRSTPESNCPQLLQQFQDLDSSN